MTQVAANKNIMTALGSKTGGLGAYSHTVKLSPMACRNRVLKKFNLYTPQGDLHYFQKASMTNRPSLRTDSTHNERQQSKNHEYICKHIY